MSVDPCTAALLLGALGGVCAAALPCSTLQYRTQQRYAELLVSTSECKAKRTKAAPRPPPRIVQAQRSVVECRGVWHPLRVGDSGRRINHGAAMGTNIDGSGDCRPKGQVATELLP